MRKLIGINESVKDSIPVDKFDTDLTYDQKVFYFKGSKIDSVEKAEEVLKYVAFKGIITRWKLSKEDREVLFNTIWKAIPNKYHITCFGNRGAVTRGVKNSKNIEIFYKDKVSKFDGAWYLNNNIDETIIFSENEAPNDIKYLDISNDIGKKHNFRKSVPSIEGGKQLNFDDDLVMVYQDGKVIYKGIEDSEPMKRADWTWDAKNKYYTYKDYIKVVK